MAQIKEVSNAFIFTLGNEVVHGRVVNTNAAYLGRRLVLLGFNVVGNISLIDDVDIISHFIKLVINRFSPVIIITTGGLGPTYDDRTLEAVALATNNPLELNEEALKEVRRKYEEAGLEMTRERLKMAYLPRGAKAISNPVGTAPGSWLELPNLKSIIISLPGVPKELTAMWEKWVEPKLLEIAPKKYLAEARIKVVGLPESSLAPIIAKLVKKYEDVYVKSHPKGHEVREPVIEVYLMTCSTTKELATRRVNEAKEELINLLNRSGMKFRII